MTKELEIRKRKQAVLNLQKALNTANDDPCTTPGLRVALSKELHRAQAKLAELTGSTEP